jgi:hypothetical protein
MTPYYQDEQNGVTQTKERTDYQRGYYASTRGMRYQPESTDWVRGWHAGKLDLAILGKDRVDDDDPAPVKQRELP